MDMDYLSVGDRVRYVYNYEELYESDDEFIDELKLLDGRRGTIIHITGPGNEYPYYVTFDDAHILEDIGIDCGHRLYNGERVEYFTFRRTEILSDSELVLDNEECELNTDISIFVM